MPNVEKKQQIASGSPYFDESEFCNKKTVPNEARIPKLAPKIAYTIA